jgi:hypothetical protein
VRGSRSPFWIASAIAAGAACAYAAVPATPIDRALPLAAIVAVLLAWIAERPAIALAAPALLVCSVVFVDEHSRLLAYGVVMAAAFAAAVVLHAHPLIAALAIVMLRWIPWHDVVLWRELVLLIGAMLIVAAMPRSALGIFLAVATALFTPGWPMKTLAIPYLVAMLALLIVWSDRRPRLAPALALGLMLAFYPWSGVMARGWRAFLNPPRDGERQEIRYALHPGQSATFDIPDGASLIVSAANAQRLRRGTLLGRIDPQGIPIRVGDASDWGFMRREEWFRSRNGYPRDPAGRIRDYGFPAWIDGAGRIRLPREAGTIRVTADPHLPPAAVLQVESAELEPR